MSLANAWEVELDADERPSTNIVDLLAFALFPLGALALPGLGVAVPLNEAAAVAYVLVLLRRPPSTDLRIPVWLGGGLLLLLAWFALVSALAGPLDIRRLGHLAIGTALCLMLASGRVGIRSAARGLATGLLVGLVASIVLLPRSSYEGRLTGWFGDPNAAGFALVAMSLAVCGLTSDRRVRWLMVLPLLLGTGLTVSRTSYLALGCALVWLLVGRWLGSALATAAVAVGIWSIQHIPYDRYFASSFEDRFGSDLLRGRILEAERESIAQSPWTGHGAGAQTVDIGDNTFFFHNSYLSVLHEVGVIGLGIYLVVVAVLWQHAVHLPLARRNAWLEASVLAMLVCGMNLGDVLLSLVAFVLIGLLARHVLVERAAMAQAEPDAGQVRVVGPAPWAPRRAG